MANSNRELLSGSLPHDGSVRQGGNDRSKPGQSEGRQRSCPLRAEDDSLQHRKEGFKLYNTRLVLYPRNLFYWFQPVLPKVTFYFDCSHDQQLYWRIPAIMFLLHRY
ncbi:hypothetical protein L7F22_032400 [Adiantum nelumboides]|nr:hypothetical protein [Adiantum nelumboides]